MATADFNELLKVLRRKVPSRPVLFEYFMNVNLYKHVLGLEDLPTGAFGVNKMIIDVFHKLGYDYASCLAGFSFTKGEQEHKSTISLNSGNLITDWKSFEEYEWPTVADFDYDVLEQLKPELPDGMKIMFSGPSGVLENTIALMGFENLCVMIYTEPELVREVVDNVGRCLVEHYKIACEYDSVGLIMSNDDWGFKTQPMLSPDLMREYIIPWHKKIVETAHAAGRPCVLHSCGNLDLLMDDIIDDIGFDGKHSYEDAILPVEEAYERWGERIAVLGGIDMNYLCTADPSAITKRAEAMLERSMDRGGYALGSGNSIPDWVPEESYFAMIRAAGRTSSILR